MSESSNISPEKLINFQVTPASKLFVSIASLCDSQFNPKGIAMVDITEKGFEITVRNAESKAAGYLFLKSSGLINFHCSKPIVGKIINVAQLMVNASNNHDDDDDDIVTIFQLVGSNNLNFIHGNDPNTEYNVEVSEMNVEIEKIPNITLFCEAVLTSEHLREMIYRVDKLGAYVPVSVDITEKFVAVFVGDDRPWTYKYVSDKVVGTRGMAAGQMHHASFLLPHLEAMWEASFVVPCCLMCFLSEPAGNVMIRFCLRQLGDLVFIIKAERIIPNSDEAVVALKLLPGRPNSYMTI